MWPLNILFLSYSVENLQLFLPCFVFQENTRMLLMFFEILIDFPACAPCHLIDQRYLPFVTATTP